MPRIELLYPIFAVSLLLPNTGIAAPLLYGGNGNSGTNDGALVLVDQTTGAGAIIGAPTINGLTGLAFNPDTGALYGTTNRGGNLLLSINPGDGSFISSLALSIAVGDLTFQPGSDILFAISNTGNIYTIDTSTGSSTLIGDTGTGRTGGLAFGPDGVLYLAGNDPNNVVTGASLFTINTSDGSATLVHSLDRFYDGLAFRQDGTFFAVAGLITGGDVIYNFDSTGAAETLVGSTGTGKLSDLDFSPVPEPSSWLLGGLGLAGLLIGRRRPLRARR